MDEDDVIERVTAWMRGRKGIDRVVTNWEPLVILAARIRERHGMPGMSVDTAGLPRQAAHEGAGEGGRPPRAASSRVGAPLRRRARRRRGDRLPHGGQAHRRAPAAPTPTVSSRAELERALAQMYGVPRQLRGVHRGRGVHLRHRVHRRQTRLRERRVVPAEAPRGAQRGVDLAGHHHRAKRCTSRSSARASSSAARCSRRSNMGDGFTHMEWYLTPKGEAVFGEIGCRPGGAHLVDQMNYTCDIDLFREWARRLPPPIFRQHEAPLQRRDRVQARARRGAHLAHRGPRRLAPRVRRLGGGGAPPAPRHAPP
jgi:hypothetical protein